MKTYKYVEEYLDVLAGYGETTNSLTMLGAKWLLPENERKIKLAQSDINVVNSIADGIVFGNALTDRQACLVCRLVLKYQKQFAMAGIDVTPINTPEYKRPLRIINRNRTIDIVDEKIRVYFPYDASLISQLKDYKKSSIGQFSFNYDTKLWSLALTEQNIYYLVEWGKTHNFDICTELLTMFNKIIMCEQIPYKIELIKTDTGYTITNAADSLISFIEENLGGFGFDNINTLVDYAGVLGYCVNRNCKAESNTLIQIFGDTQNIRLDPNEENLSTILQYAKLTDRLPMVIYQPAASINPSSRKVIESFFTPEEIVNIDITGRLTGNSNVDTAKVICIEKFPKELILNKIPLMVTYHEMLHGANKQSWLKSSERIIYMCNSKLKKTHEPGEYE
jgi:hypothetical protein